MHFLKLRRCLLLRPIFSSYSSSLNPNNLITTTVTSLHKTPFSTSTKKPSSSSSSISNTAGDDEWNDAWETAWLPNEPPSDHVTFPSAAAPAASTSEIDADTKAFVAEMDERWNERRAAKRLSLSSVKEAKEENREKEKKKKDGDEYRLTKQRIHAGLWMKEIEKMEEAKLGNPTAAGDEMDRLLDSCSE